MDPISSLPGARSRSVFGGGRLRWVDSVRIGGSGGSMIRHAPEPAACPVDPVAVAVIVPSLPASLVALVGDAVSLRAGPLPAAATAVFVAPVTMTADPEDPETADPRAKPLTQWLFAVPHRRLSGEPDNRDSTWRAWSFLQRMDRSGSSARHKKLDRGLTGGVLRYLPRPSRVSVVMTVQWVTIGAHRSAVVSSAPCLCVDALPLMGVFTELFESPWEPRTTPGAARLAP